MNDTKNDIMHPHDLLVRNIFGDADLTADLIRNHLPPDLTSNLDLNRLRREAVESINPGLSELLGDLRFSGKFKGTGQELRVFVFLEHQSRPDRFMSFRLLEYVFAAYRQHLSNSRGKGKPATFPYPLAIVLHHGKKPWKSVTPMRELIDIGPGAPKEILDFPIFLIDLPRIEPEQLKGNPVVCAALDILQSASTGRLSERAKDIFNRLRSQRKDRRLKRWAHALGTYYVCIQERIQAKHDDVTDILQPVLGKQEAMKMGITIAEGYRLEGEAKGKAEGKAEGEAEGTAKTIIAFLEARFGTVPAGLRKKVTLMRGSKKLERAIKACATCESLKAFEKTL